MPQTQRNRLKLLQGDDRGVGIVTVLLVVMFIAILGSTLVYMSYNGLLMRAAERQGTENFYDASSALDEIRAGLQQVATESISVAYADVLTRYDSIMSSGGNVTEEFHRAFAEAVLAWAPSEGATPLVSVGSTYDLSMLAGFTVQPDPAVGEVVISSDSNMVQQNAEGIVFKNLQVSYTDAERSYTTEVEADVLLKYPGLTYAPSTAITSDVPDFVLVAKESLQQTTVGQHRIDGSAYAGDVHLSGKNNTLSVAGGYFITPELVSVDLAHALTVEANAQLWAKEIALGNEASFTLEGEAYVADDLALGGDASTAVLGGSYYGFGTGGGEGDTATESSAILVNGVGSTLELANSDRLVLAGHSFVDTSSAGSGGESLLMGESISAKSNQLIYMVPVTHMDFVAEGDLAELTQNPAVLTTDMTVTEVEAAVKLKENQPLFTIGTEQRSYEDYSASMEARRYAVGGAGNQAVWYFYLSFATAEDANNYFRDHFAASPEEITDYLGLYATLDNATGQIQTSGHGVEQVDGTYEILPTTDETQLKTVAAPLVSAYENLCKTLSPVSTSTADDNPYDYIVNQTEVDSFVDAQGGGGSPWTFYNESNEAVAVLATGDYTITGSTPDTLRVVLAMGDVTVNADFEGLILSGQTVDLRASVASAPGEVQAAFLSTFTDGTVFGRFLDIVEGASSTVPGVADDPVWDLDELVVYENWTKD